MRKSYNDSGLTAKRSYRLLTAGLTAILMAVTFASCATYQKPLLDDAYYWPGEQEEIRSIEPSQPSQPSQPSPIEYLNVQDTTVTIRIKR